MDGKTTEPGLPPGGREGNLKVRQLYSTWRMAYIEAPRHEGCIFCDFPAEGRDEEHFIVHRGSACFVILNLYPYNPGHMMVIPFRHTCVFESMTRDEALEMHRFTAHALKVLKKLMNPEGFNIGINLGRPAGAGVADHMHQHIVPRWNGDTNFMPVLAETRMLPQAVEETYVNIKRVWDELPME